MAVKINNYNIPGGGVFSAHGVETHKINQNETLLFKRTLTELSEEAYTAHISELKKQVEEQGALLSDKVDIKEFEKYRRLIQKFVDEIVSNSYTFQRESSYASRGRHRYIATVNKINEKLDELGKEVMEDQADKIEILSRIDDIRGLLLDLMT